ncbi:MAG: pilus assembly protein PilP [Cyanobacteria bacterium K_DeepCast_35m_m1_288]|nr:pilus assembly protein PilP [Cyanobacteria bacterium K_DeepCast_35m_m1_288]
MASSRDDASDHSRVLSGRRVCCGWLSGVALLPAITACASSSGPETITLPPPNPKPAAEKPAAAEPAPAAGFTPLPTPEQVVTALPTGRLDPFAPLPQAKAAASGAVPAGDLRFTGVIRSAGQAQALVQVGDQSGAVCVGRRGVCVGSGLPALLPADWSVTSIDVASGRLVLNQAGQRRVFNL